MNDLAATWRRLAQSAGLPDPVIHWSLQGEPLTPESTQVFRSPAGTATLVRAANGWEIRYDDGIACRIERNGRLVISVGGLPPDARPSPRLAGPVTALVMSSCGFYPLHAAGLVVGERLYAVSAGSGQGKSTLAACAARHGSRIAGDDLLAVSSQGTVEGLPGALRIHPSLAPAGWSPTTRLSDGRGWYPLPPLERRELGGVLLLERGAPGDLVVERGANRLTALMRAGFLSHLVVDAPGHWHGIIDQLMATVPVWRLRVPQGLDRLDAEWPRIQARLEHPAAS
jgi:hypothetical protein